MMRRRKRTHPSNETSTPRAIDASATFQVHTLDDIAWEVSAVVDVGPVRAGSADGWVVLRADGSVEWRTARTGYSVEYWVGEAGIRDEGEPTCLVVLDEVLGRSGAGEVAVGASDGRLSVYSVRRRRLLDEVPLGASGIVCMVLQPMGSAVAASSAAASDRPLACLACGCGDGRVRWAVATATSILPSSWSQTSNATAPSCTWHIERSVMLAPGTPQTAMAWHPHGRWLAVGDAAGAIRCVDAHGRVVAAMGALQRGGAPAAITSIAVDPQHGHYVVSGDSTGRICLWDMSSTTAGGHLLCEVGSIENMVGAVRALCALPGGMVVAGAADGGIGTLQRLPDGSSNNHTWVASRARSLHARGVRCIAAVTQLHTGSARGSSYRPGHVVMSGGEDARLCVIGDLQRYIQHERVVQRVFPQRRPAVNDWQVEAVSGEVLAVYRQRVAIWSPVQSPDGALRWRPTVQVAPRQEDALAAAAYDADTRHLLLVGSDVSVRLFHRTAADALQPVSLPAKVVRAGAGARAVAVARRGLFAALARDGTALQLMQLPISSTTTAAVAVAAVAVLQTVSLSDDPSGLCISTDGDGAVGIGHASGRVIRVDVPEADTAAAIQVQTVRDGDGTCPITAIAVCGRPPCVWCVDAQHALWCGDQEWMRLPAPRHGVYYAVSATATSPHRLLLCTSADALVAVDVHRRAVVWRAGPPRANILAGGWLSSSSSTGAAAVVMVRRPWTAVASTALPDAVERKRYGT